MLCILFFCNITNFMDASTVNNRCEWFSNLWFLIIWNKDLFYSILLSSFLYFFVCYLSSPNIGLKSPRLTTQIPVGQVPVGWAHTLDHNTRQIHKGVIPYSLWLVECQGHLQSQHSTQHRQKLKLLTLREIEPGSPGWQAGNLTTTLRRRTRGRFKWNSNPVFVLVTLGNRKLTIVTMFSLFLLILALSQCFAMANLEHVCKLLLHGTKWAPLKQRKVLRNLKWALP